MPFWKIAASSWPRKFVDTGEVLLARVNVDANIEGKQLLVTVPRERNMCVTRIVKRDPHYSMDPRTYGTFGGNERADDWKILGGYSGDSVGLALWERHVMQALQCDNAIVGVSNPVYTEGLHFAWIVQHPEPDSLRFWIDVFGYFLDN